MPDQNRAARDPQVSPIGAARAEDPRQGPGGIGEKSPLSAFAAQQTPAAGDGYSGMQIVLHWLIAALVLAQLIVNDAVRLAFRGRLEGAAETALGLGAYFHLTSGLVILGLTLIRLFLRLTRGAPPPPTGGPVLFEWMGILAHWGLYALLLAMTLSGAAAWFAPSAVFAVLHESLRFALIGLILAHILGALVEHFVFGNRVIRRMLPKA